MSPFTPSYERFPRRHAEEAMALWAIRDTHLSSRASNLITLSRLDRRLLANLTGITLDAQECWRMIRKSLSRKEIGAAFAATYLALQPPGNRTWLEQILMEIDQSPRILYEAVAAFEWLPSFPVEIHAALMRSEWNIARALGVGACAALPFPPIPANLFSDSDFRVREMACFAAGKQCSSLILSTLQQHVEYGTTEERHLALTAGSHLRSTYAMKQLREDVLEQRDLATSSVELLVRASADRQGLVDALIGRIPFSLSARALAALGTHGAVSKLIEFALDPHNFAHSVYGLEDILGVSFVGLGILEQQDLEQPMTDETRLNDKVAQLRQGCDPIARSTFAEAVRVIAGQPTTEQALFTILFSGQQRARTAASLELSLARGSVVCSVTAPSFLQRRQLAQRVRRNVATS